MKQTVCLFAVFLCAHSSLEHPATIIRFKAEDWSHALPFHRRLEIQSPSMSGKDVTILQNLLRRNNHLSSLEATGIFDENTRKALIYFQKIKQLWPQDGVLNAETAKAVIGSLIHDGYKDNGIVPDKCLFKLHVPVHRDRTIETNATLFKCGNGGKVLHVFRVRTRGSTGEKGVRLNQLSRNGDTPTGLSTIDLNSREPVAFVKSYGPYPVLRVVKGIKGNAALGRDNYIGKDGRDTFLSDYRSGILVHTGIWSGWDESQPMPDSNGCIHVHPKEMKTIVELIKKETGAVVNQNPFSKLPYPYKPQGIISVEEID